MHALLWADGGTHRSNPGPAGWGFVLRTREGPASRLVSRCGHIGPGTNNEAEYSGLIAGLEEAQRLGVTNLTVFMDSMLIINQVFGTWKVKKQHLRPLNEKARNLARTFHAITGRHVPREENRHADMLAGLGCQPWSWSPKNSRGEYQCGHDYGHPGFPTPDSSHGCDGCCSRIDFPGRST